ncbi:MAG: hypothetical protein HY335_06450 [Deinococcus sp.]|nr:hypothetical protein [Deinococcus sp.]
MTLQRWWNQALARWLVRFPALLAIWSRTRRFRKAETIPWMPLQKPLIQCRLALVTTAGVHLKEQPPFDMADPNGDPSFRELPGAVQAEQLRITHDYYDHRDADQDINIVFPIDRLRELVALGLIAGVAPHHYGFMGHIDKHHVDTLVTKTAPEVARRLRRDRVDAVLLTPA